MTDQEKREKVVTHLQILRTWCAVNPYYEIGLCVEDCVKAVEWLDDALALLKEQEPRVMTLEGALGAEVNVDQCWLEVKGIKQIYLADAVVCPEHVERADIQRWGASDCQLPLDLYGAYWRMWTSKPTQAQRKAVKWDG